MKTFLSIALTIIIVSGLILFLTSCMTSKITDAKPGKLVASEKIRNSTYFKVTVRTDSCTDYVGKWNSHCWKCEVARVPETWYVVIQRNGKSFIEPVK